MAISELNFHYQLKYVIIGAAGAGKTYILLKNSHHEFKEKFISTIVDAFYAKNIQLDDKIFLLQIWDTSAIESFHSITRKYLKNSVCACLVYDITNRSTFKEIKYWIEDCKKFGPKNILMVLVGNKINLKVEREISFNEGNELAKKHGMLFFECSAKMIYKY